LSSPPYSAPEHPDSAESRVHDDDDVPVLPAQSSEDTDIGWGDYAEPDDDRLIRDRPPHWDDV
jgi:hypothetical protein